MLNDEMREIFLLQYTILDRLPLWLFTSNKYISKFVFKSQTE